MSNANYLLQGRAIAHVHFHCREGSNPISIHADVVKNISAPLDAMTNNGVMTDSTTIVVVLDDVGVEVFQKFCQFAYTGDYTLDETDPDQEDKAKDSAGTTAKMKPDAEKPSQRRHRKLYLQAHPMNSSG